MNKAAAMRRIANGTRGERKGKLDIGSDESVQATASDAASGKLAAATLGYFRDPFIGLFVGTPNASAAPVAAGPGIKGPLPPRRLPPVINRGNFARVSCIEKFVLEFLASAVASSPSSSSPSPHVSAAHVSDGVHKEATSWCNPGGGANDDLPCSTMMTDMTMTATTASGGTSRKRNPPQVISLGAGKDSLFFRLKEAGRAPTGGYFEVDFEAVSTWKARLIETTPALSALAGSGTAGGPGAPLSPDDKGGYKHAPFPGCYRLVSGDLRDTGVLEDKLRAAGVNFSAPTVFLAECVLVYMEDHESDALLRWCSSTFPDSLFAAYEMTKPNDAFGIMMRQNIQRMGCLLPGLEPYPTLVSQEKRFLEAGWGSARAADMLEIYQCFLEPVEVRRTSKIEVLDEIEEWELIMRHYCLVVAAKGHDAAGRLAKLSLNERKPP